MKREEVNSKFFKEININIKNFSNIKTELNSDTKENDMVIIINNSNSEKIKNPQKNLNYTFFEQLNKNALTDLDKTKNQKENGNNIAYSPPLLFEKKNFNISAENIDNNKNIFLNSENEKNFKNRKNLKDQKIIGKKTFRSIDENSIKNKNTIDFCKTGKKLIDVNNYIFIKNFTYIKQFGYDIIDKKEFEFICKKKNYESISQFDFRDEEKIIQKKLNELHYIPFN
jgi:hypothetical protein